MTSRPRTGIKEQQTVRQTRICPRVSHAGTIESDTPFTAVPLNRYSSKLVATSENTIMEDQGNEYRQDQPGHRPID